LSIAAAADAAAQTPDQATARLEIAGGLALLTVPLIVGVISDIVGAATIASHGIRTAAMETSANAGEDAEHQIAPVPHPTG